MIPQHLRPFFWEVNPDSFDPRDHAKYVIGRLLDQGTDQAVAWMKATFREDEIKKVIREDRRLSPKSATYWALVYEIPTEEVTALSNQPASR
jgi:hypothetical protein